MTPFTAAAPDPDAAPENPRAIKGGNRPTIAASLADAVSDLGERLEIEFEDIKKRTTELNAAFKRVPAVVTKENAGNVSDQIAQIAAHSKAADALRTAAVAPVLKAQRQINTWFDANCFDDLDTDKSTTAAKQAMTIRLTIYERAKAAEELRQRLEAERIAREAAETAAREAAEAAQALTTEEGLSEAIAAEQRATEAMATAQAAIEATFAPAATMSTVRGDLGSSSSLRANWKARAVDKHGKPCVGWLGVNLNDLRGFIGDDVLAKAANAHARLHKNTKPITGIEFYDDATAVVRG